MISLLVRVTFVTLHVFLVLYQSRPSPKIQRRDTVWKHCDPFPAPASIVAHGNTIIYILLFLTEKNG